ncbi:Putative rRNA biogenesis protein RRP36 [Septoria linicola]|uniref:rRNA biogenesis protein RRP36 n=1 Tax=Septoria linicola TaxID=215465 RepID=A0A9Q9AN82_9PEZI|nr:putative rRNA biogenesis protein RRP36 [Septoria linicola]USW49525.1 Putative rRNA biogenesis protein RRP36 [Septoria linicola]
MAQKLHNVRSRPNRVSEDDREVSEEEMPSEEHVSMDEGDQDVIAESDSEISEESGNEQQGEKYERQISSISFGALKEAHDAISRKRKRGSDTNADQEDKLAALRDRLRQIKEQKASTATAQSAVSGRSDSSKRLNRSQGDSDVGSDSGSDSGPSEAGAPSRSRTSKHAPTAQSTRYQVSRKRQVVDVPKRNVRDPRFDAFQQHAHSGTSDKAYSFLQDYQRDEIKELRAEIKRTKNEEDKDVLRRKVNSMENRLKAKAAKDREQEVLRRHRKEERAKVEGGKTPYYLKQKEIKEQALVEKFKGMKSKDRQKLIDKRQKKESQKEKKRMPDARRMATG